MKFWVGVTDSDWFSQLSAEPALELNFWQPKGESPYRQLEPGAFFLFKLKAPYNCIAGGAYFVKSTKLPLSLAWETFGRLNGVSSIENFKSKIRRYAASNIVDPEIGCTILTQPFFGIVLIGFRVLTLLKEASYGGNTTIQLNPMVEHFGIK